MSAAGGGPQLLLAPQPATQLRRADPADWPVDASWRAVVVEFFKSAAGRGLLAFLQSRIDAGAVIFPPRPLRALELTPLPAVRAVILGQDPYHGRGQAEGLAFSVAPGVRVPPSLRNIFKELQRDLGVAPPAFPAPGGSLLAWAEAGVLLLNTCLTVEEGRPASHAGKGWEALTDALIKAVAARPEPVAFFLWGAHAQTKQALVLQAGGPHPVLAANHPSPLSASRAPTPFIGCGHFGDGAPWLKDALG